ncbi:MAG: hypothetical protein K6U74_10605, partial [Firmicutes bacterium]|nr:hypothetical protein [Bacillota bacterium]
MESFVVSFLQHDEGRLFARLRHATLPLELAMEIVLEGNVSTWRGQVCWSGETAIEADIYFPFFSRFCISGPQVDRVILPRMSGSVLHPLGKLNEGSLHNAYIGGMASPAFLVEDGSRGIAFLDDNRADFAADPGACVRRTFV